MKKIAVLVGTLACASFAQAATLEARDCWIRALDLKPELACGYFAPRVDSSAQAEVPAKA